MIAVVLVVAASAALFVLLYYTGILTVSSKRAKLYVGSEGRNQVGASFSGCSGSIYKIIRFSEKRSYSFCLTGHYRKGAVEVTISKGKHKLLTLNTETPFGEIPVERSKAYCIQVRFHEAEGDYRLEWS